MSTQSRAMQGPSNASRSTALKRAASASLPPDELERYLESARDLVVDELRHVVPQARTHSGRLYELMLDYPLRAAKALRPALCIASCRALGGRLEPVVRSAAVLELYHNAFLIHDDIEDDSDLRRGGATLHRAHGVPIAINVGDAMLALALEPLLANMRVLGLGKSLRILQAVGEMARITAEGQASELAWIRDAEWDLTDRDYVRMVYKKSAVYSFVTPAVVGALAADVDGQALTSLRRFTTLLGVAFQIQDDVLNIVGAESDYGKEIGGDLWEGKRTLILLHALRNATAAEREQAVAVLAKSRPAGSTTPVHTVLDQLAASGEISRAAMEQIRAALPGSVQTEEKTSDDVTFLSALIEQQGSVEFARSEARRRATRARSSLESIPGLRDSVHKKFLHGLIDFVVEREW